MLADADLDRAADAAITGCFYLAGQCCTAAERILVHEKVHDEFVDKLVARTKQIKVGDPLDDLLDGVAAIAETAREADKLLAVGETVGAK